MLICAFGLVASAIADDAAPEGAPDEVVIEAPRDDGVQAVDLDRRQIEATPGRSADELLRVVPGLQLSAHGGRGKAFQFLVRGFDAGHGQDVAGFVEGVPLNEVSNVHGNGYLDLYFVPPILVDGLRAGLGASRADVGDFGTAASVELSLGLTREGLLTEVGGGTDRSGTALLAWRPRGAEAGTFVTADVDAGQGVQPGRGWRLLRSAWGAELPLGEARWRMLIMAYDGGFESPGVLRQDDVDAGRVGFYQAYPGAGGGRSSRGLVSTSVTWDSLRLGGRLLGYATRRHLSLQQNYTGFVLDLAHGDATAQVQDDLQVGARGEAHGTAWGGRLRLAGGADLRLDWIHQSDQHVDADGAPWDVHYDGSARQAELGGWAEARISPARWLSVEPGLRVEGVWIDALRRVDELPGPPRARFAAPAVAPKAQVTLRPHERVELRLAYGRGFRSPEARAVRADGRAQITLADTVEAGVHAQPLGGLDLRAGVFAAWLSDELVFDHVQGRFLSSGATRRVGGEAAVAWRPVDALRIALDASAADARQAASGQPVPFAPRWMGSLGVYAEGLQLGPTWWSGGLRGRVVGQRPLPGGFVSHVAVVGDLTLHGEWRGWVLDVDLDNALFNRWRDGEFVFPSYWDTTRPESELKVPQLIAGDPTALRVAVGRRFGCGRCSP